MTDEERRLYRIIGDMTGLAQAGICQSSASGKNAFLADIVDIGKKEGLDILGMPTDSDEREVYMAELT